uniref:Uncharacterized protein n=1 Tax=Romanomermis culicivorax TaxID=13658 RepID=A0A915KV96_ROMCU
MEQRIVEFGSQIYLRNHSKNRPMPSGPQQRK